MKLFACGDIVNCQNRDGLICSPKLERIIETSDYAVCNFEAPIEGFGLPQEKKGQHLSQQKETIKGLKQHGFDLLLLANNHMLDFGAEGLRATAQEANINGLDYIGAGENTTAAYKPQIKHFGDVKIGIINAGEAQFGVLDFFERQKTAGYAWINHHIIDKTVTTLKNKQQCDFVLIFSHAGLENYSIPQKEWRIRYKYLCDLGADVVVGTHPHIPQGYEQYNNSLIFYSLGNFYFDGGTWANDKNKSFAIILNLAKGQHATFEPIFHHTIDGKVVVSKEDESIDLADLNNQLHHGYKEAHDLMVMLAYKHIHRNLVAALLPFPLGVTAKRMLGIIATSLMGRREKENKACVALHIFRNEAYYYVIRHALEILAEESSKK